MSSAASLIAAWEARLSATRKARLSNPDDSEGTTPDDARIEAAAEDAIRDFQQRVQVVFDESSPDHVRLACRYLTLYLMEFGASGAEAAAKERQSVEADADKAAMVWGGRRRVDPLVTGQYRHSEPTQPELPPFDDAMWGDYIPNQPGRSRDRWRNSTDSS